MIEFAVAVLKEDPERLMRWENERNLTKMRTTLGRQLMWFLLFETAAIFMMVAFQGFGFYGFYLNNNFFTVFANATIIQVAGLVFIVVRSLFPDGASDAVAVTPKDTKVADPSPDMTGAPLT